jgi:hypothetical protein
MYGGEGGILRLSHSRVLFRGQPQEYATAAGGDHLVHHEPALLVSDAATLYHFNHLIRGREVQLLEQGSLQVHSQDLTIPAIAKPANQAGRDRPGAKVACHDSQR